jgi:hypothetical protein
MTYDFVVGTERRKGHVTQSRSRKEERAPTTRSSQTKWCLDDVDTIEMSDGETAMVYWDAEVFGEGGDPDLVMREERDLALILNCEGEIWIGRSEPTLDGRIGLAVYNERGKILMVGIGDLVTLPGGKKRLQGGLENPFSWRAASPKACAHVKPYVKPTQDKPDAGTK